MRRWFKRRPRRSALPAADAAKPQVTEPRIWLYSRPGCHLCDEARVVIEQVCAQLGTQYQEFDITADPQLLEQYWEQIPVTFVDGNQHDFWRVDPARLVAALTR